MREELLTVARARLALVIVAVRVLVAADRGRVVVVVGWGEEGVRSVAAGAVVGGLAGVEG